MDFLVTLSPRRPPRVRDCPAGSGDPGRCGRLPDSTQAKLQAQPQDGHTQRARVSGALPFLRVHISFPYLLLPKFYTLISLLASSFPPHLFFPPPQVVAGTSIPKYCVMSDAANVARFLEQQGEGMRIHIRWLFTAYFFKYCFFII